MCDCSQVHNAVSIVMWASRVRTSGQYTYKRSMATQTTKNAWRVRITLLFVSLSVCVCERLVSTCALMVFLIFPSVSISDVTTPGRRLQPPSVESVTPHTRTHVIVSWAPDVAFAPANHKHNRVINLRCAVKLVLCGLCGWCGKMNIYMHVLEHKLQFHNIRTLAHTALTTNVRVRLPNRRYLCHQINPHN